MVSSKRQPYGGLASSVSLRINTLHGTPFVLSEAKEGVVVARASSFLALDKCNVEQ